MTSITPFRPHSIADRAFWEEVGDGSIYAEFRAGIATTLADLPKVIPVPTASDILATRWSNDRARVDRHIQGDRKRLSALVIQRCLAGYVGSEPDTVLLDWLWALANEGSWAFSAHMAMELPRLDIPIPDLGTCEMAALLAESIEVLEPWMNAMSINLIPSLVTLIDRHILDMFGRGDFVWWMDESGNVTNWSGVCAGSLLAACDALTTVGYSRPAARERALRGLRRYLDESFTPGGECDEGMVYWKYGLLFASLGLSRLNRAELCQGVDLERLIQVAQYPEKVHLTGEYCFCGNDASVKFGKAPMSLVPWLAGISESPWLWEWVHRAPDFGERHLGLLLREIAGVRAASLHEKRGISGPSTSRQPMLLEDQQTAILRVPTGRGELLGVLTGGHNDERHNHNDLGHFLVCLDGKMIVPDLGAPSPYPADFFGPQRYDYLSASSRGHCCPLFDDLEQIPGRDAEGKVLAWKSDVAYFALDLTGAYSPEARLKSWQRSLFAGDARLLFRDFIETGSQMVTHVIWSLEKPVPIREGELKLGPLHCQLTPSPDDLKIESISADDHALSTFPGHTLYRIAAQYGDCSLAPLEIITCITPRER